MPVRFDLVMHQDAPFAELVERCRRAEELGFEAVYVTDTTGDYRDWGSYWLDGWTVLAALAATTERIRIGVLVSSPIIRPPVLLAKQALAVDQISGGRLELGIGAGALSADHEAMGSDEWPPRERAARFAEYVAIVDGLLRAPGPDFDFEGRFHRTRAAPSAPGPAQRPRPPIIVGGQAPTVLRVAAERADCWNTPGPLGRGAGADELIEITRRQNAELDELCAARGRDPATLRRSLLMYGALDPWTSPPDFEEIVERSRDAGMDELVVLWPPADRLERFERVATDVIPALRSESR